MGGHTGGQTTTAPASGGSVAEVDQPPALGGTGATGGSVPTAPAGSGGWAAPESNVTGGNQASGGAEVLAGTGGSGATAGKASTGGQSGAAAEGGGAGEDGTIGGFAGAPAAGTAGAPAGGTAGAPAAGTAGAPTAGAPGDSGTAGAANKGGRGPGCPVGAPCAGYTVFGIPEPANDDPYSMLIDMDGNEVHRWPIMGFPTRMLPGGAVIGCYGVVSGSYDYISLRQLSWDGDLEWSYGQWYGGATGRPAARQHHDYERQGNPVGYYAPGQNFVDRGTTLILAHTYQEEPTIHEGTLMDDVIYEVDWSGTLTGFEWHGLDHFSEFGFDAAAREDLLTRNPGAASLDWLHGNSLSRVGPNHWFDEGHEEFDPENLIYSSRDASFVAIISHETGELVWRIGPDFAGRPEEVLGQFIGQHHAHLIPKGLPGEGNMLVFDNGSSSGYGPDPESGATQRYSRGYSRVIEFDPTTFDIVWEYGAASGEEYFFSYFVSSAQRLPNGNTLIAIGNDIRIIEVTPDHRVVWEHELDPATMSTDWIYRAYRVPPDWLPAGENRRLGNYVGWAEQFEADGPQAN